jgi:hypothetical protein
MTLTDDLAQNYVRHAGTDYVGLWQIVARLREQHGYVEQDALTDMTLKVVRQLITRGVHPGDYDRNGFRRWPLDADASIERIRREWNALADDPTLAEPICWFAPR